MSMRHRQLPMAPGLLISTGGLIVFAGLALAVMPEFSGGIYLPQNNLVTEFDQDINESLHKINQEAPAGGSIFNDITHFRSEFWNKRLRPAVALADAAASVGPVSLRVKLSAVRVR